MLLSIALTLAPGFARAEGRADVDDPPVPVKSVSPEYPAEMKLAGVAGLVTISVLVDENGDVLEPKVAKSTRAEFEAPALAAVAKWKFRPARKAGANVKVRVSIPVKFSTEA